MNHAIAPYCPSAPLGNKHSQLYFSGERCVWCASTKELDQADHMDQALELMELVAAFASPEEIQQQLDMLEINAVEAFASAIEMFGEERGRAYIERCKQILHAQQLAIA